MADIDGDGRLSVEEFDVAMHYIGVARSGKPVPSSLPQEFTPPSYRKTTEKPVISAVPPKPVPPTAVPAPITGIARPSASVARPPGPGIQPPAGPTRKPAATAISVRPLASSVQAPNVLATSTAPAKAVSDPFGLDIVEVIDAIGGPCAAPVLLPTVGSAALQAQPSGGSDWAVLDEPSGFGSVQWPTVGSSTNQGQPWPTDDGPTANGNANGFEDNAETDRTDGLTAEEAAKAEAAGEIFSVSLIYFILK